MAETLMGVPGGSILRGRGALDRLTGGDGADRFVLGDASGPFYDDGTPGLGSTDLALITDFQPGDTIQLHGSPGDYALVSGRHAGVRGLRIDSLLSGTAEANATVTVFDNGVQIGTTVAGALGGWTFTPTTPRMRRSRCRCAADPDPCRSDT